MAPPVRPPLIGEVISKARGHKTGAGKKAVALKLKYPNLSEAQIAAKVGCDPANVHRALNAFLGEKISEEEHESFMQNQADVLSRVKHRIVKSIAEEDIAKASLLQRATAFGIIHDKEQLLRGNPTSMNVVVLLEAVQTIRDMRSNRT
jgi:hypothetical protein